MMAQVPDLLQGPEPAETGELHFKLYSKLKVFESTAKYDNGKYNLLAVSQCYGLVFVGNSNGFSVIQAKSIKGTTNFQDFLRKDVSLCLKTTHICVDFSQKNLAVACSSQAGAILYIYSIPSFTSKEITPTKVLQLSKLVQNELAEVSELSWQPNPDAIIMVGMSDGSVISINPNVNESSVHTLPKSTQAMCFCWSPKGKQLVIGCGNGCLSQYKPVLKLVKTIPPPPLFNGAVTVISVFWISNYQFAVSYNDKNNPSSFPIFAIVNAAKNEPVNVINYDDITYSSTHLRQNQIYISHQSEWNLIFVSSSNSMEVAVLNSKDNSSWEQWLLGDASRAELPLNSSRQETFPVGMAFDFTSSENILWGENSLPPMPRLLLLSHEGILCIFNVVNLVANIPQLCKPPKEELPDLLFINSSTNVAVTAPAIAPVPLAPAPLPALDQSVQVPKSFPSQPTFGMPKPNFTSGFNTGLISTGGFSFQSQSATPQTTVSAPGGTTKDPLQTQSTNVLQFQLQQQPQQQTATNIFSINLSASGSPNFSPKPTTVVQFGTSNTPTFTFGTTLANSSFVNKPMSTQSVTTSEITLSKQSSTLPTNQPNVKDELVQQGNIFANKTNLPQSTPLKSVDNSQKPVVKPTAAVNKSPEIKPEETVTNGKSPSGSSSPALPELPAVDDSIYLNALRDEIDHFNSELQLLSQKMKNLNLEVGSIEDKEKLRRTIEDLYNFWKELKETTVAQNSEIHSVVTDLMESFAWLEDAKSRNVQRKNPSFIELKKSEELDPISARHMREIGHLKYYIENQLKQLRSHLDKEWMDHQDSYRMEVKNQLAVPPLEEIYKTMHLQLKILNKQRTLVEELKNKIMVKKRQNKSINTLIVNSTPILPTSQESSRVSELSKLADNLLQLKINRNESVWVYENWEAMKSQLKIIRDRSKKLSLEKQATLRDVLSERDMVRIRPVKTSIESSSFLRSLALEKSVQKTATKENEIKLQEKEKPSSPVKSKTVVPSKPKPEPKSKPKGEKPEEKPQPKKQEQPQKTMFVFGNATLQEKSSTTSKTASVSVGERSPLASLTSVVSNLGKETDPKSTGVLSNAFSFPKPTAAVISKESFVFGSTDAKPKKTEEGKASTMFTFTSTKPAENIFPKTSEPPKFDGKLIFGSTLPPFTVPVQEPGKSKPNTAVSVSPAVTSALSFTSSSTTVTSTTSTVLPKVNLVFGAKDQTTAPSTGNLFSVSTTSSGFSFDSGSIFGSTNTTTTTTSSTLTTSTPTAFTFSQPAADKKVVVTEISFTTRSPESENNEVDVVTVDEPKKPEETQPVSKPPSNLVFEIKPQTKLPTETTFATSSFTTPVSNVQAVPSIQNSAVTTSKPTVSTSTSAASTPPSSVFGQGMGSGTTSPLFTFSTSGSGLSIFGQTTTAATAPPPPPSSSTITTTATTTLVTVAVSSTIQVQATATVVTATSTATTTTILTPSILSPSASGAPSSPSVSQQSPTITPAPEKPPATMGIFGGGNITTNIFEGSTSPASKPIFAQAASGATGNIFGGGSPSLTSAASTFGQPTSPTSTTSAFTDSVSQTANIFGQLLSESNQSTNLFVTSSSTATTTPNLFSGSKNIFSSATTTSSSSPLFGGSGTSLFGSGRSVFGGQSAAQSTASSSIFGQTATSNNSFFGQNICSPFSASTSVASNQSSLDSGGFGSKPIFGQRPFGQMTGTSSLFGGSTTSSIFGGASNTSSSATNVFQTTSTSFGATPGPFSSSQGSVAETGFKAANNFQKPVGGFGSSPVFGGGPSSSGFGMAPTFSGGPTFGSQPTFGTASGVFNSSQGSFSQPQGHSTTFENLANQNTVGFGNLAQQSQGQVGFGGFNSTPAFESKPAFGGSSFSNWRST